MQSARMECRSNAAQFLPRAARWAPALLLAALSSTGSSEPQRTLATAVSGLAFQTAETRALQNDEFANPGLLWVDRGQAAWDKGCRHCHGDASAMKNVATRYPAYDPASARLINLTQKISRCRTGKSGLEAAAYESDALIALTALVTHQSTGQPFQVDVSASARPFFAAGRAYFYERKGQMNLACHHCHEQNVGRMLRGDRLSQGQVTGYPTYRFEWQSMGSLQRRLRACNAGIRAEPFDYGAPEYVNLELYLAWRAADLPIEAPAVRR